MADLNTTRRNLLGAMAVAPLAGTLGTIAMPAVGSTPKWNAIVSEWERVRAMWDPIAVAADQAEARHRRNPTEQTKADHERLDALSCEWMARDDAALRQIMATPAPNFEAVVLKLQLGEEHCLPEVIECAVADIRRLASH